jgi:predicted ATP-grasp superfamily ATP-dependent carboligase
LRAGLRPWCTDLFRDADLQARCPGVVLPRGRYPQGFLEAAEQAPPGPWMYTGALENHPALVQELARQRPLWGNDAPVLAVVRSPATVVKILHDAGVCFPAVRTRAVDVPRQGRWLVKPLASAGGSHIGFYRDDGPAPHRRGVYYQQYVEGDACAAVYVGDGQQAHLWGVTRQLIGEPWLYAGPFHYCASIGPLPLTPALRQALERLGNVLVRGSGLRGLFGVDFVLRDDIPWPVEINPRYTASMEVLEHAFGTAALTLHRQVFDHPSASALRWTHPTNVRRDWIGKAILFARGPLIFPREGPWMAALRCPGPLDELPAFADIPPAGQSIGAGRPILTLFARAESATSCLSTLRHVAADLDRSLFGP